MSDVDVLMITYNAPEYTRRALAALMDSCDEHTRLWVWHNGLHEETLSVVSDIARSDDRVHRFHHSAHNERTRTPTNWLWSEASGAYLSKVDDDCLVQQGWLELLRHAHTLAPDLGVVGSWRFYDTDEVAAAARKTVPLGDGVSLMRNAWVQGSGYLLPRSRVLRHGLLRPDESFPKYCLALARGGLRNGWRVPFVHEEHMDDPLSPYTLLKTDDDLTARMPLSAQQVGVNTLQEWNAMLRADARYLQTAPINPYLHSGLGRRALAVLQRAGLVRFASPFSASG